MCFGMFYVVQGSWFVSLVAIYLSKVSCDEKKVDKKQASFFMTFILLVQCESHIV